MRGGSHLYDPTLAHGWLVGARFGRPTLRERIAIWREIRFKYNGISGLDGCSWTRLEGYGHGDRGGGVAGFGRSERLTVGDERVIKADVRPECSNHPEERI
jgi:hypothetical protein